ncbi:MAG: NAD(P)/FAD-dependent oxidoreductase [Dialister micraerophilus]|nr:NAD(P)/FAD-dependent oxidoreductase [Dialister micraerophilus]
MNSTNKKVAVIGAGVAGMLASLICAEQGANVLLFEKMDRVGLKMGITGKGRCNITNIRPIMEFIEKTPGNGKFLYSAYRKFSNVNLLDMLHEWGLKTVTERGGRVFPETQSAQTVRHFFMRKLDEMHVNLYLKEPAVRIFVKDGAVSKVFTEKGVYDVDAVIVCTGGKSYPRTGSTGDGYRMAEELGHKIVTIRPALIPLVCKESYCKAMQGLSLRNVNLVIKGKKKKSEAFGEMIFTHFGISGPIVLSLSDMVSALLLNEDCLKAYIDLKPALSHEVLDKRILREFEKFHLKQISTVMKELLPHKMIDIVLELSGINKDLPVSEVKKAQRISLVKTIKAFPLTITGTRPIEEAIVTAGGVSVKEVNSSTMESKKVKNLYFAGEVLDIHAFTGGFNIQAAFSTGYTAAINASEDKNA